MTSVRICTLCGLNHSPRTCPLNRRRPAASVWAATVTALLLGACAVTPPSVGIGITPPPADLMVPPRPLPDIPRNEARADVRASYYAASRAVCVDRGETIAGLQTWARAVTSN